MTIFNKAIEHWFADTIGKCFEMSVKENYDSLKYASEFMNSEWGSELLTEERIKEYTSLPYMFEKSKKNLDISEGKTCDPYMMWMYGYLVKYWVGTRNISPKTVWKMLPLDKFDNLFGFYHTQGWDYIINDVEKRC